MTPLVLLVALAQPEPVAMTVSAAPLPRNFYRCRLLPRLDELRPGEALYEPIQLALGADDLLQGPLAPADLKLARSFLAEFNESVEAAEQAALRTEPLLRLVSTRKAVSGATLLLLRARIALHEDRVADAVRDLGLILSLTRQVSTRPTFEARHTATTMARFALDGLEQAVTHRRCPNLSAALDELPRPLLPLGPTLEGERLIACGTLPGAAQVRRDPLHGQLDAETRQRLIDLFSREYPAPPARRVLPLTNEFRLAAAIQAVLPRGQQVMRDHGYSEADIKQMPILNVALLAPILEHEDTLSRIATAAALPYPEARAWFLANSDPPPRRARDGLLFSRQHLKPTAFELFFDAQCHLQRRLDLLRAVEALRAHAHAAGRWPERLADVTAVSVSEDPLTGRPFVYRREGDIAILEAPRPTPKSPDEHVFTYRLTLRKPEGKP
jgi:hypothetical protein